MVLPSRLCEAVRHGSREDMKRILGGRHFKVNKQDHNGRTALSVAASEGQMEAVRLLLESGALPNVKDRFDNTPLYDAVRFNHLAAARVIAKCARPDPSLVCVWLLLQEGCQLFSKLKLKLGLKACVCAPARYGGKLLLEERRLAVILCEAVVACNLGLIKALVTFGADVNAADYDSRTALHLASCTGNLEALTMLVELGADARVRDRMGGSPLDDAIREKQYRAMQVLYESGSRPEGERVRGRACVCGCGCVYVCVFVCDGRRKHTKRTREVSHAPDGPSQYTSLRNHSDPSEPLSRFACQL